MATSDVRFINEHKVSSVCVGFVYLIPVNKLINNGCSVEGPLVQISQYFV